MDLMTPFGKRKLSKGYGGESVRLVLEGRGRCVGRSDWSKAIFQGSGNVGSSDKMSRSVRAEMVGFAWEERSEE